MKNPFRILIADDHEIIRRGLSAVIESEWGWEICGEASNGTDAVAMAEQLKPDVVVMDVAMRGLNGVDATRKSNACCRPPRCSPSPAPRANRSAINFSPLARAAGCAKRMPVSSSFPRSRALREGKPFLGAQISQLVFETYLKGGVVSGKGV